MTDSPVGTLLLDAEKRALKKATKTHTSTAPCGCEVEVGWFSTASRRSAIRRCPQHEVRR